MSEGGHSDHFAEIRALEKRPGTLCAFSRLETSDPALAASVHAAIDEGLQLRAISRWLAKKDVLIKDDTLKRHHAGECCRGR